MAAADHLSVPRQHGLFLHHGIDLGDGTIAHYLEGREILRSPLEEFKRGLETSVVEHEHPSPPGVTLRRAMSRIGEQRYNLLFNNCEHFASWCKTGRHQSGQVESFLHTTSLGALAIGQLMPAALLTGLRLLLKRGLVNEQSRDRARRGLVQLKKLRQRLLNQLEGTLEQAEGWIRGGPNNGASDRYGGQGQRLLKAGQTLADELAAVEELEQRISDLLNEQHGPSISDQAE
ncbi:lecithin retinol acyltransferase family protein [Synechococcus sp. WH 8016]|uniref:lecithin retinol acyltransferase family protein n=1 Tax=Synechococcus sp. WH 8016 TaxID=166318 RepID=UPI00022D9F10|nr:lecithin retinol acyltransferase family protein [Synechococcus sp. WH 8016]EHA59160.1 NC domain protein [Synechococcus sp. WH 8016]